MTSTPVPRSVSEARLHAAAPYMLAALKKLVASQDRAEQEGWISHPQWDDARAAIAKAEGRSLTAA